MKSNEPYMLSLIGALRHEARKELAADISSEAYNKLFTELVANALALGTENAEMLYVMMLVLNSFLKEQRESKERS